MLLWQPASFSMRLYVSPLIQPSREGACLPRAPVVSRCPASPFACHEVSCPSCRPLKISHEWKKIPEQCQQQKDASHRELKPLAFEYFPLKKHDYGKDCHYE